jgi:dihydropteroate synthase
MAQGTAFYEKIDQIFNPNGDALVMGILNITPDSFSDGGSYLSEAEWMAQCTTMVKQGADIIDIGGFSTRPGFTEVSPQEEENRVIPVILSIRKQFPNLLISIDTFRATLAEKAVRAGANIINDISGGQFDAQMFATVARLQVPYVLMHNSPALQTMHANRTVNPNIVQEVFDFLQTQSQKLKALGTNQIIIDPGFGFAKTLEDNFALHQHLQTFQSLPYPLLIGISRKSMIKATSTTDTESRNARTTDLHRSALANGARILRVHDVAHAKQLINHPF